MALAWRTPFGAWIGRFQNGVSATPVTLASDRIRISYRAPGRYQWEMTDGQGGRWFVEVPKTTGLAHGRRNGSPFRREGQIKEMCMVAFAAETITIRLASSRSPAIMWMESECFSAIFAMFRRNISPQERLYGMPAAAVLPKIAGSVRVSGL